MALLDFLMTGQTGLPVQQLADDPAAKLKQVEAQLKARADVADKVVSATGPTSPPPAAPGFDAVVTPALPQTATDIAPPLAPRQSVSNANSPAPAPQVQAAPQPAPLPARQGGSFFDVLSAMGRGYNAGGLVSAIGDAGQVAEGGGTNETLKWLRGKGISDQGLAMAAESPQIMKSMVGELLKTGKSSDPTSIKEYKFAMQQKIMESSRLGTKPEIPTFTEWQRANKKAGATNVNVGTGKLSKGEEARDKAFGKEYVDFVAKGGFADAEKQLSQLQLVQDALISGDKNLTGPILGQLSDTVTAFTNPEALDMRELVEEVVQRNLRLVLGAQFTEREGERLIARAYNPKLKEEVNAKRVARLAGAMKSALAAKRKAAAYFEEHGTLRGYKGATQAAIEESVLRAAGSDLDTANSKWSIKRAN